MNVDALTRVDFPIRGSGEDAPDHFAGDIGEAEAAAVVGVGQPLVIDPEQVQDRRVQVVDVDGVDGGTRSRPRRSRRG